MPPTVGAIFHELTHSYGWDVKQRYCKAAAAISNWKVLPWKRRQHFSHRKDCPCLTWRWIGKAVFKMNRCRCGAVRGFNSS